MDYITLLTKKKKKEIKEKQVLAFKKQSYLKKHGEAEGWSDGTPSQPILHTVGDWDNHCYSLFYLSTLNISPLNNFMRRAVQYHDHCPQWMACITVGSPLLSDSAGWLTAFGKMKAVTGKDSPWYHPCFKPLNEPYCTGDGKSGLRAGPQGDSLSLVP